MKLTKPGITGMLASAVLGMTMLAACDVHVHQSAASGEKPATKAAPVQPGAAHTPQQPAGGQASVPDTPPPSKDYVSADQACIDKQNLWTTGAGGIDNVNAQTDAAGLQGAVANPYDQSEVTVSPDPQAIQQAANKLLASSSTAAAMPIPCGDTAGYYETAMRDYHQAAADALAHNYDQANYLIRKGADAMAWLEGPSEQIAIGYITGPNGDY